MELGAAVLDEGVVVAEGGPGALRDVGELDEFPVGHVGVVHAEEVADGGRDVEAGAFVQVGLGAFGAKDVLPVVGAERAGVLPLGVADAVLEPDGDPAAFADGFLRPLEGLAEPRDDAGGLGLEALRGDVVVGEGDVKGVLARGEGGGRVGGGAGGFFRRVGAAVVAGPLRVPAAFVVGDGVVFRGAFADPEGGGDDGVAPGVLAGGFPGIREREEAESGESAAVAIAHGVLAVAGLGLDLPGGDGGGVELVTGKDGGEGGQSDSQPAEECVPFHGSSAGRGFSVPGTGHSLTSGRFAGCARGDDEVGSGIAEVGSFSELRGGAAG